MRRFALATAALALLSAPAAAQVYSPSQTGTIGAIVSATDPSGNPIRAVMPSFAGAVASGSADSGNPVKVGGVYNSTPPTYATGQRADLQVGPKGALRTAIARDSDGLPVDVASFTSDGQAAANLGLVVNARTMGFNGTSEDRIPGDAGGLVVQPYGLASKRWAYAAAAGGIVNSTTAATMKAAAGAGVRNYLTSCQISSDTLGGATELVIRDGAAGTVLWRSKLQTGPLSPLAVTFGAPLAGTANTLMEVATLTAVTGGVFINCQGFAGS